MPEGPEVTTTAAQLHDLVSKKIIKQIKIVSGPYLKNDSIRTALQMIKSGPEIAFKIDSVSKKGKFMWFRILKLKRDVNKARVVSVFNIGSSFGLTGEWSTIPSEYTRVEFDISPTRIYYNDKLSMGKLSILSNAELDTKLAQLGPDVYDIDYDTFKNISGPSYLSIVNQKLISGIGNYLRSEIIAAAGGDPLGVIKPAALYAAVVKCSKEALAAGGSEDYKDIYGTPGKYKPKTYMNPEKKVLIDKNRRKFYFA